MHKHTIYMYFGLRYIKSYTLRSAQYLTINKTQDLKNRIVESTVLQKPKDVTHIVQTIGTKLIFRWENQQRVFYY